MFVNISLLCFFSLKPQLEDYNRTEIYGFYLKKSQQDKGPLLRKIIYLQSVQYKNSAMKWVFECQINNIESRTDRHRYKVK